MHKVVSVEVASSSFFVACKPCKKDTTEQFTTLPTSYPNSQPVGTAVKSLYCGVCSKHPSIASKDSENTKK